MSRMMMLPSVPDWEYLAEYYEHGGHGLLRRNIPFIEAVGVCRGRLAYLATPYSRHAVKADGQWCPVRSDAMAHEAAKWAAHCAVNGLTVVSPIVQAVASINADASRSIDPLDEKFWTTWCAPMLRACHAVIVPPIDGWEISAGIWHEVCQALYSNRPVYVIRKGSEYGEGS